MPPEIAEASIRKAVIGKHDELGEQSPHDMPGMLQRLDLGDYVHVRLFFGGPKGVIGWYSKTNKC